MKLSYEKACVEAGLSEDQIKEIRKIFNNDRKKLKEEKDLMDAKGISCVSTVSFEDGVDITLEIQDSNIDIELEIEHKILLEQLSVFLEEMERPTKEMILAYFNDEVSFKAYAESLHVSRTTLIARVEKEVDGLRKKFGLK